MMFDFIKRRRDERLATESFEQDLEKLTDPGLLDRLIEPVRSCHIAVTHDDESWLITVRIKKPAKLRKSIDGIIAFN